MGGDRLGRVLAPLVACCLVLAAACSGDGGDSGDGGGEGGGGSGSATADRATVGTTGDPLEIRTELGLVRGGDSSVEGVRAFLALPYAAPPTGDDRWRPPQPREPYEGTFDATEPGGSCPQEVGGSTARFTVIPDPVEDCLTLDVWAPDDARDLPVMVWFHGGGLRAGSAHQPYYNGDDMASEGVVVVGVNYRLGPFGFLATDELADEGGDDGYGNYGLADQAASLDWVQRNIAAFGGDPDNVTIFGESAGGGSVCAHMASPLSEGLFHRAVIQSGGGCGGGVIGVGDAEQARAAGAELMEAVGCDDLACLRETPTDELLAVDFNGGFVRDGVRLAETGRERAAAGDLDGVEVLIGSNAEEAFLFTLEMDEPSDDELVDLAAEFTDRPEDLVALYPRDEFESNLERFRALRTDVSFACPTLAFAEAAETDTYVYNYAFESQDERFGFGPTHGAELAFLFAHPEGITNVEPGLSGPEAQVSADMQAAWTRFAAEGVPGDEDLWRPYADGGRVTVIDDPLQLVDEIRGGRCDQVTELTEGAA